MLTRWRLGTPARLSLLFVGVAGTLLVALAWLWQSLLAADRAEAGRQHLDRLAQAAVVLAHEVDRGLDGWASAASSELTREREADPPAGTALLIFDAAGVRHTAGLPVPFLPAVPRVVSSRSPVLVSAVALEFRDPVAAATAYRQAASTGHAEQRAAALAGLARVQRRQGLLRQALATYADLAAVGDTPVAGFPARLIALRERSLIFTALGDDTAGRDELVTLAKTLASGESPIDRATFDVFRSALPDVNPVPSSALAEAVWELYPRWEQTAEGRAGVIVAGQPFVSVWGRLERVSAAIVGPLDVLMTATQSTADDLRVKASVVDADGTTVWGEGTEGAPVVSRRVTALHAPWDLRLAAGAPTTPSSAWSSRRAVITAGFALMALVIAVASYVVFRSVRRELDVARLQSDFVAAVSHEFRSPLTAMRHLTDVLEEGTASPDQVPRYYTALGLETRRLHGLVEGLLDFGRMQAGRRAYRLEPDDAVDVARSVVEEYRPQAATASHGLQFTPADVSVPVHVDRTALSLAIRNLIDNAVKYSPDGSTVTVSVQPNGTRVAIGVHDSGEGIPADEQRRIFGQFVRGSAAAARHVKGTGIGLTVVAQIVRGHGGRLDLHSQPGDGTSFTILLPLATVEARGGGRS